jgi:hypothetical protein
MVETIKCKVCNKVIAPTEMRVTWKEHSIKPIQIDLELNFHRDCWVKHYNESLDKKVQFMAKQIMKNAQPMIKEFAGRYGGMSA